MPRRDCPLCIRARGRARQGQGCCCPIHPLWSQQAASRPQAHRGRAVSMNTSVNAEGRATWRGRVLVCRWESHCCYPCIHAAAVMPCICCGPLAAVSGCSALAGGSCTNRGGVAWILLVQSECASCLHPGISVRLCYSSSLMTGTIMRGCAGYVVHAIPAHVGPPRRTQSIYTGVKAEKV